MWVRRALQRAESRGRTGTQVARAWTGLLGDGPFRIYHNIAGAMDGEGNEQNFNKKTELFFLSFSCILYIPYQRFQLASLLHSEF
jgi:hypothetical protein